MGATKISPKMQKPHRKIVSGLKLLASEFSSETLMRKRASSEVMEPQVELPHDLIAQEILTRLPVKSTLQFKTVSKEWYCTLSSHAFSNAHLFKTASLSSSLPVPVECLFVQADNSYYLLFYNEEEGINHFLLDYSLVKLELEFDDQNYELQLVGSSNGIVCLNSSSSHTTYVCNPITRDLFTFNDPFLSSFSNYQTSWGFGYVSCEDDYKFVRLIQDYTTHKLILHIFSLHTQRWKRVQDHGLDHSTVSLTKPNPGVLVDETLFWLLDTKGPVVVVGFSLAREKFEKIRELQPRSITPWNQCLCEMGGCLGMQEEEGRLSVLNKPGGQVHSVALPSPSDLGTRLSSGLVGSTKSGRFFVISKNWELVVINPSKLPTKYTPLVTFKGDSTTSIIRYLPTLTSPLSVSHLFNDC